MAGTVGNRWHRGSYPLQVSTSTSTIDSATMSPSASNQTAKSGSASATKIQAITPDTEFSQHPRLAEAVNGVSKYSIMSQLANDPTFALRKSIDDILAGSEESTAAPGSVTDPSPPSSSHSHSQHYPSANESMAGSMSVRSENEHHRDRPASSRSWARNNYPIHASSPDHSVLEEQPPSNPRTLRRAPGLDQLRDDSSETEVASGSYNGALSDPEFNAGSPPLAGHSSNRWTRQTYPSQSTTHSVDGQRPMELPRASEAGPNLASDSNSIPNEPLAPVIPSACPMSNQPSNTKIDGYGSRTAEHIDTPDRATAFIAEPTRGRSRHKSSFNRQTYPLQAAASFTNLRDTPTLTHPSTSEGIPDPCTVTGHTPDTRQPSSRKKKSRGVYPLHSPPSVVQLRAPPSPPSSSEEDKEPVPRSYAIQNVDQESVKARKRPNRRVDYPLQIAASIAELRPSTNALPTVAENHQPSAISEDAEVPLENPAAPNVHDRFRQHGYPLQPPSKPLPGTYTSLQPEPVEVKVAGPAHRTAASPVDEGPAESHRPRYGKRGSYPLASQPSIPALHFSPPTPPSEEDSLPAPPATTTRQEDSPESNTSRKEELATKVLRQWRRPAYPPREPSSTRDTSSSGSHLRPQASQESLNRSVSPSGPRLLPKNLRAVKDSTIPPPPSSAGGGRTIIVCLDGTGDKFDNDNSNIVHLVSALKKDDPNQVSYYQAGIGTYTTHGLNTGFSAAMDMAVGSELGLHVRDAYQFLMHSYKEGDKICIFGFSRGAYTARCLAGMVHKVGLLPPRNLQQIYFAYQFYADDSANGWEQSNAFKATFSIDVSVYFLGCFDSVASVGFIPRQLPLSTTPTNKCVFFRHAMALDERRAKFKVCRYQKVDWEDVQMGVTEGLEGTSKVDGQDGLWGKEHKKYGPEWHPNVTDEEYERLEEPDAPNDTDVKEVWFAGAHADIGGGAVPNDERHKLAQIPLRWMIRQAFECNTGIRFKTKKLAEFGIDVHTLWPKYRSLPAPAHGPPPSFLEKFDVEKGLPPRSVRRGKLVPTEEFDRDGGERLYALKSHKDEDWTPEQMEDWYDAMQPLNDQLVQAPNWWLLELWPVQYKVPIAPGEIITRTGMNLGRYRGVGDVEPLLHWTVVQRCQYLGYEIKVRTAPHTKWKVVV